MNVLAIDQGTSATKALVVAADHAVLAESNGSTARRWWLAALLLIASTASGHVVPVGSSFLVNDFTDGDQLHPQIVALPDGGFVIVYDGERCRPRAFAKRFDRAGQPTFTEFELEGIEGYQRVLAPSRDDIVR